MRPPSLWRLLSLVALLSALAGCSTHRDKILDNKRLLRGGLGTTTSLVLTPDRDTYVGTSKSIQTHPLAAGTHGSVITEGYFSASTWNLLASTVSPDSVLDVILTVTPDSMVDIPASTILALSKNSGPFDSTKTFGAPGGPAPGLTLAQATTDDPGPLRFRLGAVTYTDLVNWHDHPDQFNGFAIVGVTDPGIVVLDEKQAYLRVIYKTSSVTTDSVTTTLTRHFSLRSPLSPAPTGSEASLVLGGEFDAGLLLHFPPLTVPAGSTVNQATLRLRLDPTTPIFNSTQVAEITVQRDSTDWLESETSRDNLHPDPSTLGAASSVRVTAADTVLNVALPPAIIREWGAAGAVNNGILVLVRHNFYSPAILVRSRESALPIELRVSYTSPPPGRF